MDKRKKWIMNKIKLGWFFLAAGVLLVAAGIIIGQIYSDLPYNFKIITGVGIFLAAIGINNLVIYRKAIKNEQVALELTMSEQDERTVFIRSRAGNRAYWVSTALVFTGLMWESFAANGDLPALFGTTLWYFLAAAVLVPFGVYAGSMLIDQHRS
ncbi:MAG: hypothetical protein HGA86_05515 [Anaerolineaceae bacterium]|nr:hypothetical protein [Anaerolineaceae bacterium]